VIGKLTGRIDSIGADHVIVDVGGVGYHVHCASATLSRLHPGAVVSLAVETKVSEDAIRLYGFLAPEERDWFRLLQTVQGVGARVALSILSALKISELQRAIVLGDKGVVGRAQGVGPKLATRIVTELKDKAPAALMSRKGEGDAAAAAAAPLPVESDAIAALISLGYSPVVAGEGKLTS
jgi:Holliday junction DNA helicase RuvA